MSEQEKKGTKTLEIPETDLLKAELNRERSKSRSHLVIRSTVGVLVVAAAAAVLVATLWLPVMQIYGSSMTPSLENGDLLVAVKTSKLETGDVVAFYYNNKILVKRVICTAGDWVDIDDDGNVFVNGKMLNEPYVNEKSFGDCNISLPYQVPDEKIFVMGDHRATSIDSRNTEVGCVSEEQIVGKAVFRIWPLSRLGTIK